MSSSVHTKIQREFAEVERELEEDGARGQAPLQRGHHRLLQGMAETRSNPVSGENSTRRKQIRRRKMGSADGQVNHYRGAKPLLRTPRRSETGPHPSP